MVFITDGVYCFLKGLCLIIAAVSLVSLLAHKRLLRQEQSNVIYVSINLLYLIFKSAQRLMIITYIWMLIIFDLTSLD